MSTLSFANVTDVNLVLKERTHMRLCLNMLIFTHNLGNWLYKPDRCLTQTLRSGNSRPNGSQPDTNLTRLLSYFQFRLEISPSNDFAKCFVNMFHFLRSFFWTRFSGCARSTTFTDWRWSALCSSRPRHPWPWTGRCLNAFHASLYATSKSASKAWT